MMASKLGLSLLCLFTAFETSSCSSAITENSADSLDASQPEISRCFTLSECNPAKEAQKAARHGDFRLIGYSRRVPGILPAAYGFACFPAIKAAGDPRILVIFAASDVPNERAQSLGKQNRAFGERYNSALFADPRFPYQATCRPVTQEHESEAAKINLNLPKGARLVSGQDLAKLINGATISEPNRGYNTSATTFLPSGIYHTVRSATVLSSESGRYHVTVNSICIASCFYLAKTESGNSFTGAVSGGRFTWTPVNLAIGTEGVAEAAKPRSNPSDWIKQSDYPEADREARHRGRVQVALNIDVTGRVKSCLVRISSGYRTLDKITCELVRQRATFVPGKSQLGSPVASAFTTSVVWQP